jgi:hypothetical protein
MVDHGQDLEVNPFEGRIGGEESGAAESGEVEVNKFAIADRERGAGKDWNDQGEIERGHERPGIASDPLRGGQADGRVLGSGRGGNSDHDGRTGLELGGRQPEIGMVKRMAGRGSHGYEGDRSRRLGGPGGKKQRAHRPNGQD